MKQLKAIVVFFCLSCCHRRGCCYCFKYPITYGFDIIIYYSLLYNTNCIKSWSIHRTLKFTSPCRSVCVSLGYSTHTLTGSDRWNKADELYQFIPGWFYRKVVWCSPISMMADYKVVISVCSVCFSVFSFFSLPWTMNDWISRNGYLVVVKGRKEERKQERERERDQF